MEQPQPSDVISSRSRSISRIVTWIFTRKLRKNFYAVNVLHEPPEVDGPLIICLNHPSWNDPMVISFLSDFYFPEREAYGPIEAEALEGYRFLARAGLYPVSRGSAVGNRLSLGSGRLA